LCALESVAGVKEFQVVVQRQDLADPLSMDELVIRIAASAADRDAVSRDVVARVNEAARIRPRVEFVEAEQIYEPGRQTKVVRFVDSRS
jgi:phenylacetate-coenzyme A ligase PaaK-like adenylate-forming protein